MGACCATGAGVSRPSSCEELTIGPPSRVVTIDELLQQPTTAVGPHLNASTATFRRLDRSTNSTAVLDVCLEGRSLAPIPSDLPSTSSSDCSHEYEGWNPQQLFGKSSALLCSATVCAETSGQEMLPVEARDGSHTSLVAVHGYTAGGTLSAASIRGF